MRSFSLSLSRTHTQQAWAETAKEFIPPAWSCGVNGEQDEVNAVEGVERFLFEDGQDDDHDHFDHDHSDHDYSDHLDLSDHDHHFDASKTEDALADLKHSLRGSDLRIGKRRRVQGLSYSYWVDVYVEIDYALCAKNGETCASGIGTNTINYGEFRFFFLKCWSRIVRASLPSDSRNRVDYYSISLHSVNAIFTGANTIYEVSAKHYQCLFESLSFESCV